MKLVSIVAAPRLFFRALAPSPDYCGVPVYLIAILYLFMAILYTFLFFIQSVQFAHEQFQCNLDAICET